MHGDDGSLSVTMGVMASEDKLQLFILAVIECIDPCRACKECVHRLKAVGTFRSSAGELDVCT